MAPPLAPSAGQKPQSQSRSVLEGNKFQQIIPALGVLETLTAEGLVLLRRP